MIITHGSAMRSCLRPSRSGLACGGGVAASRGGTTDAEGASTLRAIGLLARLDRVAAELVAEGGEDAIGVGVRAAAASEALEQGKGDDRRGHVMVDGLGHRPSPLA